MVNLIRAHPVEWEIRQPFHVVIMKKTTLYNPDGPRGKISVSCWGGNRNVV